MVKGIGQTKAKDFDIRCSVAKDTEWIGPIYGAIMYKLQSYGHGHLGHQLFLTIDTDFIVENNLSHGGRNRMKTNHKHLLSKTAWAPAVGLKFSID